MDALKLLQSDWLKYDSSEVIVTDSHVTTTSRQFSTGAGRFATVTKQEIE